MTQAQPGDTVRIHYTCALPDGTVFDTSEGRDPLEFTLGKGEMLAGLENAVPGMQLGETKTVEIASDEAYGPRDPNAMQAIPRDKVPPHIPLEIGTRLQMQTPEGQAMPVMVAEVSETEVVLDANHPLAGHDLVFTIELAEIA